MLEPLIRLQDKVEVFGEDLDARNKEWAARIARFSRNMQTGMQDIEATIGSDMEEC